MESLVVEQATEDDKQRRYQSYLDKERSFHQQIATSGPAKPAAPAQPKSAPAGKSQMGKSDAGKPKKSGPKPKAKEKPRAPKTSKSDAGAKERSVSPAPKQERPVAQVRQQPEQSIAPEVHEPTQPPEDSGEELNEDTVIKF